MTEAENRNTHPTKLSTNKGGKLYRKQFRFSLSLHGEMENTKILPDTGSTTQCVSGITEMTELVYGIALNGFS